MTNSLDHRGPDNKEIEVIRKNDFIVGLGHTRLSILDLSISGNQPMKYKNLLIVFNGEIYNFKELKNILIDKGHSFQTNTDTEVILHSFEEWGVSCVERFNGMFSFVLFDCVNEQLYAFRDRVGVKPFYFCSYPDLFVFGSELKALMVHPAFEKIIDTSVLTNYFQYGYIAAPNTIFKNTHKLLPGHYLHYNLKGRDFTLSKYWDIRDYYIKPKLNLEYEEIKYNV